MAFHELYYQCSTIYQFSQRAKSNVGILVREDGRGSVAQGVCGLDI